ncbi:DUF3592 domain-containing protein [Bremerella sp. JC817]|uniref:DUF3592 domain-containing protein n=1 Tax=Bremerella sp. JC817 TaxID=3231756 RepID=UPI00345B4AE6
MNIYVKVLFFALVLIGVAILSYGMIDVVQGYSAEKWPTAKGDIVDARLRSFASGKGGTRFEAKVKYTYQVNGANYEGERIGFGYGVTDSQELPQKIVNKLKSGKQVEVRYNPKRPEDSALIPGVFSGVRFNILAGILWIVFSLGGAILISNRRSRDSLPARITVIE